MVVDLRRWVEERVEEDPALSPEAGLLVLAALESDAVLDGYLGDDSLALSSEEVPSNPPVEPEPVGAYLVSIEVKGFRGIGPRAILGFTPQPGLTIVAGRNGSGKSSFAEALEVAFTGSTYRWKNKAAQWRERWRNIHEGADSQIIVRIAEEGVGITVIGTTWAADTNEVTAYQSWFQRPGAKRQPGLRSLGWSGALETYRPLMSYDELGGMLEAGPSALYDALSRALGVEEISAAIARLTVRAKSMRKPADEVAARKKELLHQVGTLDDERGHEVLALMKKRDLDATRIRSLAMGAVPANQGPVASLRVLEGLRSPSSTDVVDAALRLQEAVEGMVAAGEAESARSLARLQIRRLALEAHADFGDMICPVCAKGDLDETWATTTSADVKRRAQNLESLELAHDALNRARTGARGLVLARPRALDRSPLPSLEEDLARARLAWDRWASAPPDDLGLVAHLQTAHSELDRALAGLRACAGTELQSRNDEWAPVATKLVALCEVMDEWGRTKGAAEAVADAAKWLKANDTRLKNERLAPIADQARAAWARLRQESNVDLGSLTLEGTQTRRRVTINATVDGESTGALAVMSQGELHALSLALFLPRATIAESPFRFIVLDDPVQAMDPSKVEGLVALLAELAKTRQVIVLSHDDRLAAAARRARVGARILEINRGAGSVVSINGVADPAERYLSDAFALVKDERLPTETLRRTLPGLLRFAVEAAARDVFFDRRLSKGSILAEVEALWSTNHSTRDRVSLAIFDEKRVLDRWLVGGVRRLGLGVVTGGLHEGLREAIEPIEACRAVEQLVHDIRTETKR